MCAQRRAHHNTIRFNPLRSALSPSVPSSVAMWLAPNSNATARCNESPAHNLMSFLPHPFYNRLRHPHGRVQLCKTSKKCDLLECLIRHQCDGAFLCNNSLDHIPFMQTRHPCTFPGQANRQTVTPFGKLQFHRNTTFIDAVHTSMQVLARYTITRQAAVAIETFRHHVG